MPRCPFCGHRLIGRNKRRGGETRERSLDKQGVPVVAYRPESWLERWTRETGIKPRAR